MTNKEQKLCDIINELLDWICMEDPEESKRISEEMEDIINGK